MFEHPLGGSYRNPVTEFFYYIFGNFLRVLGYYFELKRVFRSVHYIVARFGRCERVNQRKEHGERIVSVNKERYRENHSVYRENHRSNALVRIFLLYHRSDNIRTSRGSIGFKCARKRQPANRPADKRG